MCAVCYGAEFPGRADRAEAVAAMKVRGWRSREALLASPVCPERFLLSVSAVAQGGSRETTTVGGAPSGVCRGPRLVPAGEARPADPPELPQRPPAAWPRRMRVALRSQPAGPYFWALCSSRGPAF